LCLRAY